MGITSSSQDNAHHAAGRGSETYFGRCTGKSLSKASRGAIAMRGTSSTRIRAGIGIAVVENGNRINHDRAKVRRVRGTSGGVRLKLVCKVRSRDTAQGAGADYRASQRLDYLRPVPIESQTRKRSRPQRGLRRGR